MIKSVILRETATFQEAQTAEGLGVANFIFGENGTGKTTFSRVLANPQKYPDCKINFEKESTDWEVVVYNIDFIEENFRKSPDIPGVFTLGSSAIAVETKIEEARTETGKLKASLKELSDSVATLNDSISTQRDVAHDSCWAKMKTILSDSAFAGAFSGGKGSRKELFAKLDGIKSTKTSSPPSHNELKIQASILFDETAKKSNPIPSPPPLPTQSAELNQLLSKPIVGSSNTILSAAIEEFANGDWIRSGIRYFEDSKPICPFCQQETPKDFGQVLAEHFDDSYKKERHSIVKSLSEREQYLRSFEGWTQDVLNGRHPEINVEQFSQLSDLAKSALESEIEVLRKKTERPGSSFQAKSANQQVLKLEDFIVETNSQIEQKNKLLDDRKEKRTQWEEDCWMLLLHECTPDIKAFNSFKDKKGKTIAQKRLEIQVVEQAIETKRSEIMSLQSGLTSNKPTLEEINSALVCFGLTGFRLQLSTDETKYQIVRPDGKSARESLSEGEKTFITLLYFLHRTKGYLDKDETDKNKLVVLDDPISSLDANYLDAVASLIQELIVEASNEDSTINQVFLLSHNILFFNEITNKAAFKKSLRKKFRFWMLRREGEKSRIVQFGGSNPVTNGYDLLWWEFKQTSTDSITLENLMRRILEHYFGFVGKQSLRRICDNDSFAGPDKTACRALVSWSHRGSHHPKDALFSSNSEADSERNKKVFKMIFEKSGHIEHYEAMMEFEHKKE